MIENKVKKIVPEKNGSSCRPLSHHTKVIRMKICFIPFCYSKTVVYFLSILLFSSLSQKGMRVAQMFFAFKQARQFLMPDDC